MKQKTQIILLLLVAITATVLLPQLPLPITDIGEYPVFKKRADLENKGDIVFISDTQSPIWIETFLLDRNSNEYARDLIFREIIKENPSKVFHLGDIVAFGYKPESWKQMDSYLKAFIDKGIQFYPTMGNHELLLFPDAGKEQFLKRFPFASSTGYSIQNGKVEIVLLNSNFSDMTEKEVSKQQQWYKNRLEQLEKDSTITFVVVGTHYSPFTNSKIVSPSEEVQKLFVPQFLKSKKAKLFISGHAHAFEHFNYKGKDFLVIGGGGGLQQPLLVGNKERWKDLYNSTNFKRMFHFIKLKAKNDTLFVELNMLQSNFSKFDKSYRIKFF